MKTQFQNAESKLQDKQQEAQMMIPELLPGQKEANKAIIAEFNSLLSEKNLHVVDVPGDGNCFFYAVSRQVKIHAAVLRRIAVNYIIAHSDKFMSFIESINGQTKEAALNNLILSISKDNAHADNHIIQAMGAALNKRIEIYGADMSAPSVSGIESSSDIIKLARKDQAGSEHYFSIELGIAIAADIERYNLNPINQEVKATASEDDDWLNLDGLGIVDYLFNEDDSSVHADHSSEDKLDPNSPLEFDSKGLETIILDRLANAYIHPYNPHRSHSHFRESATLNYGPLWQESIKEQDLQNTMQAEFDIIISQEEDINRRISLDRLLELKKSVPKYVQDNALLQQFETKSEELLDIHNPERKISAHAKNIVHYLQLYCQGRGDPFWIEEAIREATKLVNKKAAREHIVPSNNDLYKELKLYINICFEALNYKNALMRAASIADYQVMDYLTQLGAIFLINHNGQTTLMNCGRSLDSKSLIYSGANAEKKQEFLKNSIKLTIDLCLKHGDRINAVDRYGDTALSKAVAKQNIFMVEYLLERGANPFVRSKNGQSVIDSAAFYCFSTNSKKTVFSEKIYNALLDIKSHHNSAYRIQYSTVNHHQARHHHVQQKAPLSRSEAYKQSRVPKQNDVTIFWAIPHVTHDNILLDHPKALDMLKISSAKGMMSQFLELGKDRSVAEAILKEIDLRGGEVNQVMELLLGNEVAPISRNIKGFKIVQVDGWMNLLLKLLELEAERNGIQVDISYAIKLKGYLDSFGFRSDAENEIIRLEGNLDERMMQDVATLFGRVIDIISEVSHNEAREFIVLRLTPRGPYDHTLLPLRLLVEDNIYSGLVVDHSSEVLEDLSKIFEGLRPINELEPNLFHQAVAEDSHINVMKNTSSNAEVHLDGENISISTIGNIFSDLHLKSW